VITVLGTGCVLHISAAALHAMARACAAHKAYATRQNSAAAQAVHQTHAASASVGGSFGAMMRFVASAAAAPAPAAHSASHTGGLPDAPDVLNRAALPVRGVFVASTIGLGVCVCADVQTSTGQTPHRQV
jgi:hypothetical protein